MNKDATLKDLRIYNVELETSFTILATNEEEAKQIAIDEGLTWVNSDDYFFSVIPVKKCKIKTPNGVSKEYYNYTCPDVFGYDHLHNGDIKDVIQQIEELEQQKQDSEEVELRQMKLELEENSEEIMS